MECLPGGIVLCRVFPASSVFPGEHLQAGSVRYLEGNGNFGKSMLRLNASQDTVGVMCLAEPSEGMGMEKKGKREKGKRKCKGKREKEI